MQEKELFMNKLAPDFLKLTKVTASNWQALENLAAEKAHDWAELVRLQVLIMEMKKAMSNSKQDLLEKKQKARHLFYWWSHGFSYNPYHTISLWQNKM